MVMTAVIPIDLRITLIGYVALEVTAERSRRQMCVDQKSPLRRALTRG